MTSSSPEPVVAGRAWLRRLAVVVGAVVAVLAALAAALFALGCLEWGGDSGPALVQVSVLPAAICLALVRWLMTAAAPRVPRTAAAVSLGALGLAAWAVALTAAFDTQSAYTSTVDTDGTATAWIVLGALGALGALVAVAASALLPLRARTAGWATGALLVALLWIPFGIARFTDNNAVIFT